MRSDLPPVTQRTAWHDYADFINVYVYFSLYPLLTFLFSLPLSSFSMLFLIFFISSLPIHEVPTPFPPFLSNQNPASCALNPAQSGLKIGWSKFKQCSFIWMQLSETSVPDHDVKLVLTWLSDQQVGVVWFSNCQKSLNMWWWLHAHHLIMVALCNRADHYIFILFLSFFLLLLLLLSFLFLA